MRLSIFVIIFQLILQPSAWAMMRSSGQSPGTPSSNQISVGVKEGTSRGENQRCPSHLNNCFTGAAALAVIQSICLFSAFVANVPEIHFLDHFFEKVDHLPMSRVQDLTNALPDLRLFISYLNSQDNSSAATLYNTSNPLRIFVRAVQDGGFDQLAEVPALENDFQILEMLPMSEFKALLAGTLVILTIFGAYEVYTRCESTHENDTEPKTSVSEWGNDRPLYF